MARRPSPLAPPFAQVGPQGRTCAALPRPAMRRTRTPTGQVCRRPTERNRPPPVQMRPHSTAAADGVGVGAPIFRRLVWPAR